MRWTIDIAKAQPGHWRDGHLVAEISAGAVCENLRLLRERLAVRKTDRYSKEIER